MSGPRMGNMGQMNGNRRPNMSRINYHDSRQSSSYHDHRQSTSSHDVRHHDNRPHESRQHESRQPMSLPMTQPQQTVNTQHDELIKYIYDSWSKVEMDKGSNSVMYYQEHENHHLKDFRPFDLEAYWGRRMHQNHHQQQQHHS